MRSEKSCKDRRRRRINSALFKVFWGLTFVSGLSASAQAPTPVGTDSSSTEEKQISSGGPDEVTAPSGGFSEQIGSLLEPFVYDPKGRRDPFRPYSEVKGPSERDASGPLLPLQRYDIDQLTLRGVIWDVADPKAMFVDPTGQIHIVRRDERVGRRNGYIAVIREGEVVVVETLNISGDLMYSTRVLRIATTK